MPPQPIGDWTDPQLQQNKQQLDALLTTSKTTVENAVKTIQLELQRQHGMAAAKQQIEEEMARRAADAIGKQAPQEELIEMYRQRLQQMGAQAVVVTDRERELLQVFRQAIDTNQPHSN
jgi:preprotein translocase subunit SecD